MPEETENAKRAPEPTFDRNFWQQARDLFFELADLSQEGQQQKLAHLDSPLRQAVASLLAGDETRDAFFEHPLNVDFDLANATLHQPLSEGQTLGTYRIVREIGRGGNGVVYLGERAAEDFEQQVAIKVVSGGLGQEAQHRFRRERRILARLEHPSIARLIDGGTTESGLPYVVMEYVAGVPITEFCRQQQLDLAARLQLFGQVCQAVTSAHRNLVVHRDLKPSNILVTDDGRPKLLDFGIAKLLSGDSLIGVDADTTRGRWWSPGYSSPEQLLGGAVTTSSDVYSLGVLLFELLTDRLPHTGEQDGDLPAILERPDPPKPSSMTTLDEPSGETSPDQSAADRGLTPLQLARRLRGDLDAIATKALRPEPGHRYPSVEQLAADIGRYLGGMAVEARRGTWAYRAGKLVRRRPLAAGSITALLILIVTFAIASRLQSQRFQRERDVAEGEKRKAEAVSTVLIDVFQLIAPAGGQLHDARAKEALDRSTDRMLNDLDAFGDLKWGIVTEVGDIYRQLAYYEKTERLLREAVEQRRLLADPLALAESLAALGQALAESNEDDAEAVLSEALDLRRSRLGDQHALVADSLGHLALPVMRRGDHEQAQELLAQALAIDERLDLERTDPGLDRFHIWAELTIYLGQTEEAERLFRDSLRRRLSVYGERHPKVARARSDLGVVLYMRGSRLEEAMSQLQTALDLRREILGEGHPNVANTRANLANLLARAGHYERAEPLYQEALTADLKRLGEEHWGTATDRNNLGLTLWNLGKLEAAERQLRRSLATRRRVLEPGHADIAMTLVNLAEVLIDAGEPAAAEELIEEALDTQRRLFGGAHWVVGDSLMNQGWAALVGGQPERARELTEEARRTLAATKVDPAEVWRRACADSILGATWADLGELEQGEGLLVDAYQQLVEQRTHRARVSRRAAGWLADLYQASGRPEEEQRYRTASLLQPE